METGCVLGPEKHSRWGLKLLIGGVVIAAIAYCAVKRRSKKGQEDLE